jgi:hypothetical protein
MHTCASARLTTKAFPEAGGVSSCLVLGGRELTGFDVDIGCLVADAWMFASQSMSCQSGHESIESDGYGIFALDEDLVGCIRIFGELKVWLCCMFCNVGYVLNSP